MSLFKSNSNENTTIILVTHDIDEAIYLSDRIFIMKANPGEIHKEITLKCQSLEIAQIQIFSIIEKSFLMNSSLHIQKHKLNLTFRGDMR